MEPTRAAIGELLIGVPREVERTQASREQPNVLLVVIDTARAERRARTATSEDRNELLPVDADGGRRWRDDPVPPDVGRRLSPIVDVEAFERAD